MQMHITCPSPAHHLHWPQRPLVTCSDRIAAVGLLAFQTSCSSSSSSSKESSYPRPKSTIQRHPVSINPPSQWPETAHAPNARDAPAARAARAAQAARVALNPSSSSSSSIVPQLQSRDHVTTAVGACNRNVVVFL
ncbi:hypothetical protein BUE80_DR013344 [Diplocarpon rosae]|nr:hypothetical protein BUE80_DR013344 [Diplocarpon rosae]